MSLLLVLPLLSIPLSAQDSSRNTGSQTINGIVLDENDEPLPGVAVYDPANISAGTSTSDSGTYSITISASCKALTFNCLGYQTLSVPIEKCARVQLETDAHAIEATVVTGIYTRKAESFTGAVHTMTSEDIRKVSNQNVFEALKNLDPSLMILDNLEQGSNPNSMASMQLRGASTFSSETTTSLKSNFVNDANMPLFILDGFETTVEKVQDMDMNRVESITILKDASAKAIYGSKAANGVIVIETKQLNSEQTLVTYTGSLSIEMPDLTSYNLCNALEKLEIERREGYYDDLAYSSQNLMDSYNLYYSRLKKALEGESTYWLSKPLRTGVSHKHSVTVELGSKELKALASFSYNNEQGAMKGSYRKVISGDVNLSYRRKNWLFRNIMSVSSMNSEDSPYGTFYDYTVMNPYDSPYDSEGNIVKVITYTIGDNEYATENPMYNATIGTYIGSEYLDFTDNFYIEYQVIKPLKLVARFGIDTKRTTSEEFYPGDHTSFYSSYYSSDDDILSKGSYELTNGSSTTFSGDVSAQFNHSFEGGHDLFATAQYTISQTKYSEVTNYAEGFPSNNMNNISFARQYATDATPTGYEGLNRYLGVLLTAGYSYKDRYMVDGTIKGSASSVFGTNNRWGIFWSAGVGWNIHKESFMSSASKWLNQLKLRFSIGSSGNQNYSSNSSLPVYTYYSSAYYNGFAGAYVSNMENPDLGWEQKMDYNLGLDFKTKHIALVLDAYIADTENMVFTRSILPSTGFSIVSDNLGKVRNKGIEASLSYKIFQKGSSFLTVFGKIAFNDNKILKISDVLRNYNRTQQENAVENGATEPVIQYYDGMPLNSIWVVPSLGIDPVTGNEIYLDKDGNMTTTWSASNLVNYGSSDPKYNGNFGLNAEWKGLGLNFVATYYGGGYLYNTTLVNKVENTSIAYNVDRRIYSGRWYTAGQSAIYRNGETSATKATSRFVQRNNVLSLSSASIYYEFPYKMIRKAKMSRLRMTLYMNDLATFSSIEIERGTSYPYARTFSFSVTATF